MTGCVSRAFISWLWLTVLAGPSIAESAEPIRIGAPFPLSGPLGNLSIGAKRAIDFALAEINAKGGIAGHPVEVKYADTEGKPDVARKEAEKLALEGYKLLFGTVTSGEGLVIAPMLARLDALLVSPYSKSAKLIGDSCNARFFRTDPSDPTEITVVGAWLQTRPEHKWVTIANDYAFGHDATDSFNALTHSMGKEVAASLFAPFGTSDYAPYIQQIKAAAPDGLFVAMAGRDSIAFLSQAVQFGMLDKQVVAGVTYNQDPAIRAVGPAVNGIWGNIDYSATIDTPENKAFVSSWAAMYGGDLPTDFEGQTYIGLQTLLQAIAKAGNPAPGEVAKALSGGTFDTLLGEATMRAEDHQLLLPIYFGQVEVIDGKPRNVAKLNLSAEKAAPPVSPACKMSVN